MTLVITCALWVVSTFILDGILRDLLPDRAERVYDVIGKINNCLVSGISNRLFGLRKEKVQTLSNEEASDEDWAGRLKYLENVIERIIAESQVELKSEIAKMRAVRVQHDIHIDARFTTRALLCPVCIVGGLGSAILTQPLSCSLLFLDCCRR